MTRDHGNPLVEALGAYIDVPEWPSYLEFNPLCDFPEKPSPEDRNEYLNKAHDRFATTRASIRMAYDIQSMIRASYRERNPCEPQNKKAIYEISALDEPFKQKSLPIFYSYTRCKMVMGILGMGKSMQLKRVLNAFPQRIAQGRCESAGWLRHTQITHLTAKMSADGSRNGLLLSILASLDKAADTDYFNEIGHRRMTVEERTLRVAKVLVVHSLGLLVIEEMQAENFIDSTYQKELRLFFLGILSFGIPIVLVGNPRAFESLGEFKQTEHRFFSFEPTELWPSHNYLDPDWVNAIAPAIWNYQVIDRAEPYSEAIAEALWDCSGGIPKYAQRLVTEVQTSVILGAIPAMSEQSLRQHFETLASFQQFRPLIDGLTQFDPDGLVASEGEDIPVNRFRAHWLRLGLIEQKSMAKDAPKLSKPKTGDWQEEKKKHLASKKRAATRKENKRKKNERIRAEVSKEDLRYHETHQDYLTRSLEELQGQIENEKQTPKRRKT